MHILSENVAKYLIIKWRCVYYKLAVCQYIEQRYYLNYEFITSLNGTAYDFHLVFNTSTMELYMYADMSMIEHSRKNSKYNKLNKILDL